MAAPNQGRTGLQRSGNQTRASISVRSQSVGLSSASFVTVILFSISKAATEQQLLHTWVGVFDIVDVTTAVNSRRFQLLARLLLSSAKPTSLHAHDRRALPVADGSLACDLHDSRDLTRGVRPRALLPFWEYVKFSYAPLARIYGINIS